MDGGFAMIRMIEPQGQCEDGLRLRQRVAKLRWMGLDAEADRLADEILHLDCELARTLPRRVPATD
jgi:hypothetical protein